MFGLSWRVPPRSDTKINNNNKSFRLCFSEFRFASRSAITNKKRPGATLPRKQKQKQDGKKKSTAYAKGKRKGAKGKGGKKGKAEEADDATLCAHCGAPDSADRKLYPCPRCRLVMYCSESCRKAHWRGAGGRAPHKESCESVALQAAVDPKEERLRARAPGGFKCPIM